MKNLTPELIEKAKSAKSVQELQSMASDAGLSYSEEEIAYFAQKLGIGAEAQLTEEEMKHIAGGTFEFNGSSTECVTEDECKELGLNPEDYRKYGSGMIGDKPGVSVPTDVYNKAKAKRK